MGNLPLQGVRVLDLSRLLPGPYCTSMLADLGCEVIKVEDPVLGDYYRDLVPEAFASLNRGKKSVTFDLKDGEERKKFYQLVTTSDILLESYRPGVTRRLGIAYEELSVLNLRLIYASLTGYGQYGPYAQLPGHDINYFGVAGLLGYSGTDEQRYDIPSYMTLADLNASIFCLSAILVALLQRKETGLGQYLDVSITDCAVSWLGRYINEGVKTKTERVNTPGYAVFQTADGKFLSLACIEEKFWHGLCSVLGEGFAERSRNTPREGINRLIAQEIAKNPLDYWIDSFGSEIPHAVVNDPRELSKDPQIAARNLLFADAAGKAYVRFPVEFSSFAYADKHWPAPERGEHNCELETMLQSEKGESLGGG